MRSFLLIPTIVMVLLAGRVGLTATQKGAPGRGEQAVTPLVHGHAHNDYEHTRPLMEALENGFCSIEADIFAVKGKLLVAHDPKHLRDERTLQSLYLDPLRQRIKSNGGRVYRGGPTVVLLIDLKTQPDVTYALLRKVLAEYADIFTVEHNGKVTHRALQAVLTGFEPRRELMADSTRYAALDGRFEDLNSKESAQMMPWVSMPWKSQFTWRGKGPMPADQRAKLRDLVARAHAGHRRIRFWDTPDKVDVWRELRAAGVDLLNVDDLSGLRAFLLKTGDLKQVLRGELVGLRCA